MIRLVSLVALALAGCDTSGGGGDGSSDMASGGQGGAGGGAGVEAGAGGAGGGGPADMEVERLDASFTPMEGCPGELHTLRGQLVREDGSGVEGGKAQICLRAPGADAPVCLRPDTTTPEGTFEISVPEGNRCVESAAMRNFFGGGGLATSFCLVEVRDDSPTTVAPPFVMFATTPAEDKPDEGDPDAVRTVKYVGGIEVDIAPDQLYTGASPAYPNLANAHVPVDADVCLQGHRGDFAGLVAFSPEADIDGDGAALRWPTEEAEGAEVALYVLGGLSCKKGDELLHEAEWSRFATVTVGAGGLISTPAGPDGLPCFNWLAYEVL